jgi:hypothetical protein
LVTPARLSLKNPPVVSPTLAAVWHAIRLSDGMAVIGRLICFRDLREASCPLSPAQLEEVRRRVLERVRVPSRCATVFLSI